MKRITRAEAKFDLMRMLNQQALARGVTIRDEVNQAAFLTELAADLRSARSSDTLIYGLRAQAMFAYVAASLGQCALLKEEDAGEIYTIDPDLRAPDYRVVMLDGSEFFAEVKNHRPPDSIGNFEGTKTYLDSLLTYTRRFQKELYFAIYWPTPKLWTLVRSDRLRITGEQFSISLIEAVRANEMARLGDVMIATLPALTLKLFSEPARPRQIAADGTVHFTIGHAELYCGDNLLAAGKETEIGWFLLHYGKWPVGQMTPEIQDGNLISTGFQAAPEERSNPDLLFEPAGFLSEMISRQYNDATAPAGAVDALAPVRSPDSFGVIIPPDFRSERIPIWRFKMQQPQAQASGTVAPRKP